MTRRTLAPAPRNFLSDLVNFNDDDADLRRLQLRYPDLFETSGAVQLARRWAVHVEEEGYEPAVPDNDVLRRYWLVPLRDKLRSIWMTDDVRAKRWGLFRILQDHFQYGDARFDQSPYRTYSGFHRARVLEPPTKIERYLLYLTDDVPTRKCQNPKCAAPYFFALRRTQRFCSDVCAKPAQSAYKRNWWKRNGKRWRAQRRAHQPQVMKKPNKKRTGAVRVRKAKKSVRA